MGSGWWVRDCDYRTRIAQLGLLATDEKGSTWTHDDHVALWHIYLSVRMVTGKPGMGIGRGVLDFLVSLHSKRYFVGTLTYSHPFNHLD